MLLSGYFHFIEMAIFTLSEMATVSLLITFVGTEIVLIPKPDWTQNAGDPNNKFVERG